MVFHNSNHHAFLGGCIQIRSSQGSSLYLIRLEGQSETFAQPNIHSPSTIFFTHCQKYSPEYLTKVKKDGKLFS